jgi:hypothetical protein
LGSKITAASTNVNSLKKQVLRRARTAVFHSLGLDIKKFSYLMGQFSSEFRFKEMTGSYPYVALELHD